MSYLKILFCSLFLTQFVSAEGFNVSGPFATADNAILNQDTLQTGASFYVYHGSATILEAESLFVSGNDVIAIINSVSVDVDALIASTIAIQIDVDSLFAGGATTYVLKTGDYIYGQITILTSTLTVGGQRFSVSGSTFVVRDGRVGVGTADPQYLLEIEDLSGNSNPTHAITNDAQSWGFQTRGGSSDRFQIMDLTGGPVPFIIYPGSDDFRFTINGGVGIDDADPDAQLEILSESAPGGFILAVSSQNDVTGNIFSISGNGNIGISVPAPAARLSLLTGNSGPAGLDMVMGTSNPEDSLKIARGAELPHMIVKANSNVGIGVANPLYRLHVNGDAYFASSVTVNAGIYGDLIADEVTSDTITVATDHLFIDGDLEILGTFHASTDTVTGHGLYLDSDNQVGIGTTNPASKFNVHNGTITISSSAYGNAGIRFQDNSFQSTAVSIVATSSEPAHSPSVASTAYVGVATVTFTNTYSRLIQCGFILSINNDGGGDRTYTTVIAIDGVPDIDHEHPSINAGNSDSLHTDHHYDTLASGEHTCSVWVKSSNATAAQIALNAHVDVIQY